VYKAARKPAIATQKRAACIAPPRCPKPSLALTPAAGHIIPEDTSIPLLEAWPPIGPAQSGVLPLLPTKMSDLHADQHDTQYEEKDLEI
jgi:hypothetical protein